MTFLPSKDREYLKKREIAYEEVEDGGQKGVVFKDYSLPLGVLHVDAADILVVLPPDYPDVAPDMFFASPWLWLAGTKKYPSKADGSRDFSGRNWQQWSRHNNEWRRGVDGIWTMLKRIDTALEIAK